MSLYRQIWIAAAILMLGIFGITFAINATTSSQYLEQQLSLKNNDDANALALSLSQQALDATVLELQLAAMLDQGAYDYIRLTSPDGTVVFERSSDVTPPLSTAVAWMKTLFPIEATPGTAEVSNGWNPIGTLTLKSMDSFAYYELWEGAQRMLVALVAAIIFAAVLGNLLLRIILRPLAQVVQQAKAIGERRFLTLDEPFTTELAEVTRSMNELAKRVKDMLTREADELTRKRATTDIDTVTGLLQREAFMGRLKNALNSAEAASTGVIALVRVSNLAKFNQLYGHNSVDNLLKDIGQSIINLGLAEDGGAAGRLNGSDFCAIAPNHSDADAFGKQLQMAIAQVIERHGMTEQSTLPGSCIDYATGDAISEVFTNLDSALIAADNAADSSMIVAVRGANLGAPAREVAVRWRELIRQGIDAKTFSLASEPVINGRGETLRWDSNLSLQVDDQVHTAKTFIPWVYRHDLGRELDQLALELALDAVHAHQAPINITLTASSFTSADFGWLESLLATHSEQAKQLTVEIGESVAFSHQASVAAFFKVAHAHGAKVGIGHVGHRIADVAKLSELGVDFIKLDPVFIHDIDSNAGNAALCRAYANIAQSLDIDCIASGVANAEELKAAFAAGATAATGSAVSVPAG